MKKQLLGLAVAATVSVASLCSQAATVVVDVSGAQSINQLREAGNTVWFVNIGAGSLLNSLSWNVTLSALNPSLLSELQLSFGGSGELDDLFTLAPAEADPASGTGSYAGSTELAGLGLAAGADGLLRIEFSEAFKDFGPGIAEGQWVSGSLSFDVTAVPEPSTWLLCLAGAGLLAARARLRRRRS